MTDTPDTTEAKFDLTDPIYAAFCDRNDLDLSNRALFASASIASEAALKALTEQGYAIIKRGEVPEWMEEIPSAGWRDQNPYPGAIIQAGHANKGRPTDTEPLYRVKTGDEG